MADDSADQSIALFRDAENKGLRLAIVARTITLITIWVWMLSTRGIDSPSSAGYGVAFLVYTALGACHYLLIGTRHDRRWVKYVFVAIDIMILSTLLATHPLIPGLDVPQTFTFRNATFPLFFVILAIAAFSLSPWLTLFSGAAGAAGWVGAHQIAIQTVANPLDWVDLPENPTSQQFIEFFLSPNFVGTGSRVQEAVFLFVVAGLFAVVIQRARKTVIKQLELDEEKRTLTEVFGRYVPPAVAESLIHDKGMLEPLEREATILFLDIANFTAMTEQAGPRGIVTILNDYFDDVARIISDHEGIITQFQGDAVLASFNVPLEHTDHAGQAVRAALDIQEITSQRHNLSSRIGICTGTVLAGNIGGGGRQTYTVHGPTVNLAARLEGLNKEYGTHILVSRPTIDLLDQTDTAGGSAKKEHFETVGKIDVRGFSDPVEILTPRAS